MAGPRSQHTDKWRQEDLERDNPTSTTHRDTSPSHRARSPGDFRLADKAKDKSRNLTSFRSRPRSVSRDRSREAARPRRRSPAPSLQPRDDDLYRPRAREGAPRNKSRSPAHHRHHSPPVGNGRNDSRSPSRNARHSRRSERRSSRDRSRSRPRSPRRLLRGGDRAYSPRPEPNHHYRQSPRRPSPDSYIPSKRRRSRSPFHQSFRPAESSRRGYSRSPPPRARKRDLSPGDLLSSKFSTDRDRRAQSPTDGYRRGHSPSRYARREDDAYLPPSKRARRSISRDSRRDAPRQTTDSAHRKDYDRKPRRSPARSTSPRGRARVDGSDNNEPDMRPSYPPPGQGRGDSRSRPPPDYSYGHHSPHYPPPPHHSHAQSPYGAAKSGWPAPSPYASHPASPYPPPPYRQPSYGPGQSPYYTAPPPPPPPQYYGASPPYHPQSYPLPPDRRSSAGYHSPPDQRGSGQPPPKTARRGHYSNLSWTPSTGSRGGVQLPPREQKLSKESEQNEKATEDDDDPFRPSKDLRADYESVKEKNSEAKSHEPAANSESQSEGKVRFAFKTKATAAPATLTGLDLSSSRVRDPGADRRTDRRDERVPRPPDRPREPPREKRLVKRIIPRPTLPPEFAASESVYFRKQGNESVIGSGTYGKVYRAIHVYTGEKVALKKIRMEGERDGFPVTAIREVKLLQSLNHDNIVKLQEVMVEKNDCYMVFEYLSHDLTGLLNHPSLRLSHAHKKDLARQLFEGLDYLHRRAVLHRDIKAANILISNTGQLKLADFGLARFFVKRRQLDYTNRVITIWYRSPELLLGETQYGPCVDIWSAACVLVEIFTKHAIFPGDGGEINQLDKIYAVLGTPTRTEWPAIVDMAWFELLRPSERKVSTFAEKYKDRMTLQAFELLTEMFRFDPTRRPTAAQVLEHPYFVEEEPAPARALELKELEGDWHEFESKALRKEKEKQDREARKVAEKRKDVDPGSDEKEAKKLKVEAEANGLSSLSATPPVPPG